MASGTNGLPFASIRLTGRGTRIVDVGPGVRVLATLRGEPILVRERNVTGATFHPELTDDLSVHASVFSA